MDLCPQENRLTIQGQLQPGDYTLPGDVSSQFISGMLFALPLLEGESTLTVTGPRESVGYVDLTLRALAQFGGWVRGLRNRAGGWPRSPPRPQPGPGGGDWSTPPLAVPGGALGGESVTVKGMDPASLQGDKAVCDVLAQMGARLHITGDRVTAFHGPFAPPRSTPGTSPTWSRFWPPWPPPFPAPPPSPGRPGCG